MKKHNLIVTLVADQDLDNLYTEGFMEWGVVALITDISERALPETDFMRYARSKGGQVLSYG
jgi:hypothetical protein